MVKEKLDINVDEALKTAKRLEKEIAEKQETVKALRIVADARRVTESLENTNESIKKEIDKNNKTLLIKGEELHVIELEVASEREKVEAKIAESRQRIKDIEVNERKRIKDVRDSSKERMEEIEKETKESIIECGKTRRDVEKKAQDAIARKDKAEREFNTLKEKLLV